MASSFREIHDNKVKSRARYLVQPRETETVETVLTIEKMAAATEEISRISWHWKSNPNPWSKNELEEWSPSSDDKNEIIEEAYQQNKNEVMIGNNYKIDFKHKVQQHITDKNRQRPIRRQTVESAESFGLREQRFNPIELPSKTFIEGNEEESKLCEKQNDRKKGEEFAKKLREIKNKSLSHIGKYCIYIYTVECFLYRILNYVLRSEDHSKLRTLGPYCFLLQNSLWNCRETNKQTQQRVYRGGKCKIQHIEQCKTAIGQTRCWSAFSSTTKNPDVTDTFTDSLASDEVCTVFIIDIVDRPFTESFGLDISSLSAIQKEAEVLLPAGINFTIDKVEYNKDARKCTIYLKI
ncbi:hypothetical protein I4U23_021956 [Adineta vaga]|nr:hypothetical protein I4U23_021956 [Adineta vaga]